MRHLHVLERLKTDIIQFISQLKVQARMKRTVIYHSSLDCTLRKLHIGSQTIVLFVIVYRIYGL